MKYVSIRRVEETKPRERVREANSVHAHSNACRCMYVITETTSSKAVTSIDFRDYYSFNDAVLIVNGGLDIYQ